VPIASRYQNILQGAGSGYGGVKDAAAGAGAQPAPEANPYSGATAAYQMQGQYSGYVVPQVRNAEEEEVEEVTMLWMSFAVLSPPRSRHMRLQSFSTCTVHVLSKGWHPAVPVCPGALRSTCSSHGSRFRYDSQIAPLTGLTLDVQGRQQQQQQQSNYGGFGGYNAGGYGGYGHMQGGQAPNGDSFKMQ